MSGCVSIDRILLKLDEYLHKNDYASAERHLCYWRTEASGAGDLQTEVLVCNELMGLYRKLGREKEAIATAEQTLDLIKAKGIGEQVGAATTYLNAATVYKAFGRAADGLPLFALAEKIYLRELSPEDSRLGGLYNNMGLALVDVGRFDEAEACYQKAISVMQKSELGGLEIAITYLNMASAAEAEHGLEDAAERIEELLSRAEELLESATKRDGYYAFVCEKCASVFGYYGHFYYAEELKRRAGRIYAGN